MVLSKSVYSDNNKYVLLLRVLAMFDFREMYTVVVKYRYHWICLMEHAKYQLSKIMRRPIYTTINRNQQHCSHSLVGNSRTTDLAKILGTNELIKNNIYFYQNENKEACQVHKQLNYTWFWYIHMPYVSIIQCLGQFTFQMVTFL